jgi:Bifunctional DNA primase/polymerase, N-terminal
VSDRHPDPAAALARGLAVFPLPAGGKRPEPGWWQRASRDPHAAAEEWIPGVNVGISCRANQIVGLDLDRHPGKPDGIAAMETTCTRWGQPWPDTFTVRTPNGLHLYFRAPATAVIGSTSGGVTPLGPSIDTRGPGLRIGGHLVGPDSIVAGVRYTIHYDAPIAELPTWITNLLTSTSPRRTPKIRHIP